MGLAVAQVLASKGAVISLGDINETALEAAAQSLKPNKHTITTVDVRNKESVDAWIARTVNEHGKLDGAVNMAGVIRPATPIADMTDDDWDFTMSINAKGVFSCLRAQIKAMSPNGSIVSSHTQPHNTQAILMITNRYQPQAHSANSALLAMLHTVPAKQQSSH